MRDWDQLRVFQANGTLVGYDIYLVVAVVFCLFVMKQFGIQIVYCALRSKCK